MLLIINIISLNIIKLLTILKLIKKASVIIKTDKEMFNKIF